MQTTFHQYQKLYSTPPWHDAHTCKVSRKYINAFSSYSAKTKRDGQTEGGALQYLPSRAFGAAGDNNTRMDVPYAFYNIVINRIVGNI